jgi:cytidylate kinase
MTASDQVRAERRQQELAANGQHWTVAEVLENLQSRDKADMERADSPLIAAQDARTLDNSAITKAEQFDLVLEWVNALKS